jgi:O-succinylbenzoic acid--CoA ligase
VSRLVALLLPPGPHFVERLRAVWDAGDAVLPLDARLPRPAVERLVAALQPARLIGPDGADQALPGGGRPVEEGDALVVATSGTTGEPKGVVLTHGAVAASSRATSARLGIDPARHHWLCCLPVAHVGGLGVITRAVWAGSGLTVLPRFSVEAVEATLTPANGAPGAGATHVSVVVSMLSQLPPELVGRFEQIVLGGSAVPASLPGNVVPTYGLTETGSGCVYGRTPLDGIEVRIDESGQILLRGPVLLRAYRTAEGETDPFVAGGWFPTGDLGTWDPTTSRLTVFGRAGDLIISGGQNVWPEPVERVLATVPGVAEVAVVGRPDERWGAAVTAVVVPADASAPPTLAQLREAVKAELAPYCAPHRVELAGQLPRTALGKIRRNLV